MPLGRNRLTMGKGIGTEGLQVTGSGRTGMEAIIWKHCS